MPENYEIHKIYSVAVQGIHCVSHPRILKQTRLSGMPTKNVFLVYLGNDIFQEWFTEIKIASPAYRFYPINTDLVFREPLTNGLFIGPIKRNTNHLLKPLEAEEFLKQVHHEFPTQNDFEKYISTLNEFKEDAIENLKARQTPIIPFDEIVANKTEKSENNHGCRILYHFHSNTPKHQ